MKKSVAPVALALFLATPFSLLAKPEKPVDTKRTPVIEAAMVMHDDVGSGCSGPLTTLTILGQNLALDEGEEPTVTLATYPPLTVCNVSASEVVAAMPEALEGEAGDYLLSIITAHGVGNFDLTIGAVGPQGPRGPAGADGLAGADGKDGLPGADGKDGLPGADGKDGLPGADGKDGLPGADGKDGLPGVSVGGWSFGYTMPNGYGFETNANSWVRVGTFVYRGTNIDPPPTMALATLYTTNTNTWYRLRLRDITNNFVIAASAPNNTGTHGAEAVVSLGVFSNLPANTAQFSIELLATDATGSASVPGRQNVGIQSFQMW